MFLKCVLFFLSQSIAATEITLQNHIDHKVDFRGNGSISSFVTIRKSISYKLRSKRASFTLQKGTFYTSKGHLLPCKRRPFGK